MHTWIEISRSALLHNFDVFGDLLGKDRLAPVIKSNAYGHGLDEVAQVLEKRCPQWLCVNYLWEASQLRAKNFAGRILVVGPLLPSDLLEALHCQADIFISNHELLHAWCSLVDRPRAHFKFDTGMSRQGFLPEQAPWVAGMLEGKSDRAVGIATHFANVEDVLDHEYGAKQLDAFTRVLEIFASRGIKLLRHAASSASSLLLAESTFDLCRVGISLYGVWPSTLTRLSYLQKFSRVPELKPVLSWRCRLMTVKEIQAGQFVGYGCTFRAVKDMKIGVLPVGYYEGLPRVVGDSQSYVLLHDKRCPIVGRICMNMTMIDLSHVSAEVGDIVTLIGKDESEEIHAGQFADWAKTIHYEIFTHLNAVMPRRIVA